MSYSDSELKDDIKEKIRKQLTLDFKAKKKFSPSLKAKDLKRRLGPILNEIRLLRAVNNHNTAEVRRLLEQGTDANSSDRENRSALHVAVSKGYADIVELLLSHGANPNQRDIIQNTPLHLAACVHNLPIISMLISANADVSCLDRLGRNPFQLASSKLRILRRGWREGDIDMVKLREELQQVVDLLLSLLMRGIEGKMERLNGTDFDDLQLTKLSINSGPVEQLDDQMSKLLGDIEKFTIT